MIRIVFSFGITLALILIGIMVHNYSYSNFWSTPYLIGSMVIAQITAISLAQRYYRHKFEPKFTKLFLVGLLTFMASELIYQMFETYYGNVFTAMNIIGNWITWSLYFSPVPLIGAFIQTKFAKKGMADIVV